MRKPNDLPGLPLLAAPLLIFLIFGQAGMARAEQDIPDLPAQPVIAQSMMAGGGEQYPQFAADRTPTMSERLVADAGGEPYPTFANPTNGGIQADYSGIM